LPSFEDVGAQLATVLTDNGANALDYSFRTIAAQTHSRQQLELRHSNNNSRRARRPLAPLKPTTRLHFNGKTMRRRFAIILLLVGAYVWGAMTVYKQIFPYSQVYFLKKKYLDPQVSQLLKYYRYFAGSSRR
jgi:hypothetical protein